MPRKKGDLYHNKAVLIVEWRADYFHQINQQLVVPTCATIDMLFATQPAAKMV